ncbi:hypothetical protein Tco_0292995, partial [Tanacetum coccineum]
VYYQRINEQKIKFMKIDLDDKTDVLIYHKTLLAKAQKEKDDLEVIVDKWNHSSKNLGKIINYSISASDKFGLGYGDYRYSGNLSYENKVFQSTVKEGVSTDFEKVSTDRPKVSTDESNVSTDEQVEGTEEIFKGTEEIFKGTEEQREGTEDKVSADEQVEGTEESNESTEDQTKEEIASKASQ